MRLSFLCACLLVVLSCGVMVMGGTVSARKDYGGYTVLRVTPDHLNEQQLEALKNVFEEKQFKINRWAWNDLMVPPTTRDAVEEYLKKHNLPFTVSMADVGAEISREEHQIAQHRKKHGANVLSYSDADFFSAYHTLDDIHTFTSNLAAKYPKLVKEEKVGVSYGGRPIWAYRVTAPATTDAPKPVVYLEFGIHAREWIAHATGTWMLNQFVTQYGTDSHITNILNHFEYIFVPVVNVDGYAYTWTTDRMWRKTVSPNPGSSCIGTDPNRNWDNHWCLPGVGGSTDPCDESYCGSRPFSELCVAAVAAYTANNTNVVAFVDFHSYSQMWMTPYGYTASPPANDAAQTAMSQQAVAALTKVFGTQYQEGSIYTTVYPASGSSADWAYDNTTHIKYSFGVELRDTGAEGFLLDPSQIIPSGQETIQAILAMGDYLIANPTVHKEEEAKELHFGNVHQYARRGKESKRAEDQAEQRPAKKLKHFKKKQH